MTAAKIKVTAIQTPSPDNTVMVARQLKESVEVGQRLRGDPKDSFVRVGELTQGGLWQLVNGVLVPSPATANPGGSIVVADSISGAGTVASPLQLSGDSASPGNTMLYGTNGSGTKGWYAQPAGGSSPLTTKGDVFVFGTANARLPVGSDGQVLTSRSSATNGVDWESPGWTLNVNESGGSLANFTAVSGTWTTSAGKIAVNNPSDASLGDNWCLKCNTAVPTGQEVVSVDLNVTTWNAGGAVGNSSASRVGFYMCGALSSQTNGLAVIVSYTNVVGQAQVWFLQPFTTAWGPPAAGSKALISLSLGTTYNFKAIKTGSQIDAYFNGAYVISSPDANVSFSDVDQFVGLFAAGVTATFANFKQFTPTLP